MPAVAVELVFTDFAAESVAMNAKHFCGATLVPLRALESSLDETFFEFSKSFFEKNSSFHHLTDEPFQLVLHDSTLRMRLN